MAALYPYIELEQKLEKPRLIETCSIPTTLPLTPPSEDEDFFKISSKPSETDIASEPQAPQPLVAVIGVGYVGTHLVEGFAQHYNVLAFDVSERRVSEITKQFQAANLPVQCTSRRQDLSAATHFLISVPTILKHDKTIDTTYLRSAVDTVAQYGRPGSTIVIESSVAVGMTREFLGPLMASHNFLVGMSPERVDPGRTVPSFHSIPKIISGLTPASLAAIHALYAPVFDIIHPVSAPEVAEMTKLYENCQRMVLAAYANEMADACLAHGIDAWEVSGAAATKPFGYLPFKPGAGIGGHCIPVNPFYLLRNCEMPLLQKATEMSWQRPANVAGRLMKELKATTPSATSTRQPRILVVGMGFKRGQSVLSNSPGVAIAVSLLSEWDAYIEYADPLVQQEALSYIPRMDTASEWNVAGLNKFDGVIVVVDQVGLDMHLLGQLDNVLVHNYCPESR